MKLQSRTQAQQQSEAMFVEKADSRRQMPNEAAAMGYKLFPGCDKSIGVAAKLEHCLLSEYP